ncbi:MAG: hypothetical protein PHQ52_03485 [Candidatus Omnitrophica bacterium]|nr:hypothetical protein [Candidatus Omnitrophota bacterium]
MKNNKKYTQPKIRSVNLDPEQAVLQVCQIGGVYFVTTVSLKCFAGGFGPYCHVSVKGVANSMGTKGIVVEAIPS